MFLRKWITLPRRNPHYTLRLFRNDMLKYSGEFQGVRARIRILIVGFGRLSFLLLARLELALRYFQKAAYLNSSPTSHERHRASRAWHEYQTNYLRRLDHYGACPIREASAKSLRPHRAISICPEDRLQMVQSLPS
jgi:hypothetical protein